MRVFAPIVKPLAHLATVGISYLAHRGRIGTKPVGDDTAGRSIVLQCLLQELQGSRLVAGLSDERFQHFAFMINRTPEPLFLAVDLDAHLIDVPTVMAETTIGNPPLFDRTCKQRTKPVPPEAYRLVADVDAPLEQQIFDIPQRKREADIHHHHKADHLGQGIETAEWAWR